VDRSDRAPGKEGKLNRSMLILTKLPQGAIYPQITQAPINNYADFLNFFRGGQTIDDNLRATVIAATLQAKMLEIAIKSRHLTKTRGAANPSESLADIFLTESGSELIQGFFDRAFCELAVAEARKSIGENDGRLHPHVGAVVAKDGKLLATGHRGENGKGDHAEYSAMQKMNKTDVEGCTVYTTLEPCSIRKLPKTPCTNHLIGSKVKRVVYGMPDKDESVYGHHSLIEAGIEIALFPDDLLKALLALNKTKNGLTHSELNRLFRLTIPHHLPMCPTTSWERPCRTTPTFLFDHLGLLVDSSPLRMLSRMFWLMVEQSKKSPSSGIKWMTERES
jgi:pyrimidine deaminase RibD-like protein